MKKVIFFDGDGTLWYPKSTKRTIAPHWIYFDKTIVDPILEFIVTPTTIKTLEILGTRGIKRVLLSTSPLPEEEAIIHRTKAAKHIGIYKLLDDIQVSPDYPEGKGERILLLLRKYGLTPEDALMIGDTFKWDYKSAQDVGVDGLLLSCVYQKEFENLINASHIIQNTSDLLDYL